MDGSQIKMSARQFIREARDETGIDIDDAAIEQPLSRLLHALNTEAVLNDRGARAMQARLLRLLCNRLRMQRDLRAHPEIAMQVVAKPVFLTGGPRTGSTKLHKLLAATGDFKYLRFWQCHCLGLRTGERDEDPSPRLAEAEAYIDWIARWAPQAQLAHAYGTTEPEEEAPILEHFICSIFPNVFAHIPSYVAWWATQDFALQAQFLKQALQYVQWQFHGDDPRPWVLKCPIYPGVEDILEAIFPGAIFVTTNRDPASILTSTVNLVQGYRYAYSDVDRSRDLAETYLTGLAVGFDSQLAVRDSRPDLKFHDVSLKQLMRSSEGVIETIYAHANMTLSEAGRDAIRRWEAEHRHAVGAGARYTFADLGLTQRAVDETFAEYTARFGQLF